MVRFGYRVDDAFEAVESLFTFHYGEIWMERFAFGLFVAEDIYIPLW